MAAKNRLQDLRDHLFETIESLRDEEKPMDIDRARAVAAVADVIIDSAKVELKFLELTGEQLDSQFMERKQLEPGKGQIRAIGDGRERA
jgi:hypothetical protein